MPKIDPNRIKAYRQLRNVTQEDLAKLLGMTKQGYAFKENGKREFTLTEAKIIADYFGTSIEDIFFNQKVNI